MDLESEIQKAKDLIAKSEHIALALPERPSIDCLAAAEVTSRALAAQGKHVGFLATVAMDAPPAPEDFSRVRNPAGLVREFIIAIETASSPIAELRYEKHDDRLEITLSPKSRPIREDSFSFREGKMQCDCIVAVGIQDIESLPASAAEPQLFTETPIAALTNSPDQKPYGEANLIASQDTPLCELAYALLRGLGGEPVDPETATFLLAGIINHTGSFRAPVRVGTHLAAARLIESGADQARAAELAETATALGLRQLTARAAVRSKEAEDRKALWSFLTAEDFEKTGRHAADVAAIMEALPRFLSSHLVHILIWQDPAERKVRGMLRSSHQILSLILEHSAGAVSNTSPALTLEAEFADFVQAEEHITGLLRQVL